MGGRRGLIVGIGGVVVCAVVAAVLLLSSGGSGGGRDGSTGGGDGGGETTANLWVNVTAGSCTRSPEPAAYHAQTACSFSDALAISKPGDRVLIRDGSYKVDPITASKSSPGVTFDAANPGRVSITGPINVRGATWLTFEDLVIHGAATLGPGASHITFRQDRITGEASAYGEAGRPAGPGSWIESEISNRGGSTEHDVTRCWINCRGLTFRDNLIRVREECPDCHNDGFQSFGDAHGIRFIGNRLINDVVGPRGNGGAGFFMKDGKGTNVEFSDNLIVNRPAGNGGYASPFQVYGLEPNPHDPFYTGYGLKMEHNTIHGNGSISSLRDCHGSRYWVQRNVLDGLTVAPDADPPSCIGGWVAANLRPHQAFNVIRASGAIGAQAGSRDTSSAPTFVQATTSDHGGDWRLAAGSPGYFGEGAVRAGITWDPDERVYGPR
jgi:hypothetical protein